MPFQQLFFKIGRPQTKSQEERVTATSEIRYCFRLQRAILRFNENSNRENATLKDGSERANIAFPKYKKGEHTVKKILVKCTYSKFIFLSITIIQSNSTCPEGNYDL